MLCMSAAETTKFWRDPALGALELLHARYVTHAFAPHMHEGYAIGVIEAGAEGFLYRSDYHIAPAGSVVVIQPGELHTGEAQTQHGWRYRMMYPEATLVQRAASTVAGRAQPLPYFRECVIHDPEVAHLLSHMHRALEAGEAAIERESRLLWALAQLITRHAEAATHPRVARPERHSVQRVRDYLEGNFTQNIPLDTLAEQARLSPYHLLRVFRAEVGLPPHAYLTQVRVRHAKRLLALGLPIAEVAAQSGFSDQSHLTRHFKRQVGVTPGQYLTAARALA
jgi:AraC-like DNA-binding protein